MPRRKLPEVGEIIHITVRCNNREFLFDLDSQFDSMVSWVNCLPCFFDVAVHHVLFMSNHIHLLVTPRHERINKAMSYLLTNLSKYLNQNQQRTNHIFGSRYAPTVIENERHLINVIRYIYQNPLRAGMVDSVMDYPYSSLGFYTGVKNNGIIIEPDPFTRSMFNDGIDAQAIWIESISNGINPEDLSLIRHQMTRSRLKFSRSQLVDMATRKSSLAV